MKPALILWLWTGLALYGVLIIIFFRRFLKGRSKEIISKFDSADILSTCIGANYLGLQSRGGWQLRGNGVLILTSKELYFELWFPKRSIKLTLTAVKEVSSAFIHAGKSKGVPLLKVSFKENGKEDVVAWVVDDVANWKRMIISVISLQDAEAAIHPMLRLKK